MIPGMARAETAAEPLRSRRILVADDALPVRENLVEILRRLGLATSDIVVVTSADEAVEAFRRDRPSVVFMEFLGIHLEDGLDVIHEMLDTDPRCKLVLATAEPPDSPEVRAAVRAGIFAVVEKPLRHEKIRQVLADISAEEGGIQRMR